MRSPAAFTTGWPAARPTSAYRPVPCSPPAPTRHRIPLRSAAARLHARTGRSAGNGSLMRTAPVALAHLDDPAALTGAAAAVSALTHADPLAGEACSVWCAGIRHAVLHGSLPDIDVMVDPLPAVARDRWAGWLRTAADRPPDAFRPNGYVVHALQAAWAAISTSRRPPVATGTGRVERGLSAAVHGGGDTDTVAAIAGALLGAAHGAAAVPASWRQAVHGWPGLRAADLERLALRIVLARSPQRLAPHGVSADADPARGAS